MLGRPKVGGYRANMGRALDGSAFFINKTFEKHPFLSDFKTSKLATPEE